MSANKLASHRLLAAVLLSLCVIATPANADTGRTVEATFYPLFMRGELVGCQVAFSVLRQDDEFGQGRLTTADGLLVAYGPRAEPMGSMLRLGVADAGTVNFRSPARAYLVSRFRTNAPETGDSFLSETPGFRVFPYGLGDITVEAIFGLAATGMLEFSYGMPGTRVDARVRVDLRHFPDVVRGWRECLLVAMPE